MCEILWPWLQASEPIAVWLEAIALIAIFFLDWKERKENRREQMRQHEETIAQLDIARSQAEATKKSADAATEAAVAAKKSAEIAAALHRPFMGLSSVTMPPRGMATRLWNIAFALENYGTLPALDVGLRVEFFTDNAPRGQKKEPPSVQIFPSVKVISNIQLDLGDDDVAPVRDGRKKLRIEVRIPYHAEDGRRFEYTAEVSFAHGTFQIDKSETHTV